MRVLFTSLRNTSHFLPLVPFVDACRRRGHEVAVAAPADLAERVAATGAEFLPFGHPGDAGLRPLWDRLYRASEEERARIVFGEIFAGACVAAALPDLLTTVERWRPAMIVRESQEYAGVVAAEKARIPHLRVAISARSADERFLPIVAEALDVHAAHAGLLPDPSGNRLRSEATFTLFPASLEMPNVPPAFRFRVVRKAACPLPNWWSERGGAFVYLTLGTVAGSMEQMRSAYRVALEAVGDLPIRVLLTTGADLPLEALGNLPPNVHVERFVPQDDVIPHAAAVFCHGRSGTVLGTLAAGVPMVLAPMFADQSNNAERVAALGAGFAIPPTTEAAEQLRAGLTRVLTEDSFRDAARRVAAEMSALPLIDEAAVEIERMAGDRA